MRRTELLGLVLGLSLLFLACSSSNPTDELAASTSSSAAPPLETESTVATVPPSVSPLPDQRPTMEISFEGRSLGAMAMRFNTWAGESVDPVDYLPSAELVMAVGESITFTSLFEAELTVESRIQRGGLRFESISSESTVGVTASFEPSEVGVWYVNIRAKFGESVEYEGSGVLEYAAWVRVADVDAPCVTLGAAPAAVAVLTDSDGCPSSGTGELNIDTLLAEFHCFPWPPGIRIDVGGGADWFYREPFDSPSGPVEVVETPADAEPTGDFITSGQVLTSASDPDAIFIDLGDGQAERWPRDPFGTGCI